MLTLLVVRNMGTKEKTSVTQKTKEKGVTIRNLVLFNDEHNSFDFIIESLVDVCGHELNQAENCAFIAHYNGRCRIKKGTIDILRPLYVEMTRRQIIVEIT